MSNVKSTPILEAYHLKKEYEIPTGQLAVLKNIHLEIYPGEMTFIVGRSGSGKSTLLHLLGGLDRPSAGKIFFEGEDISRMQENELARLRNLRIGFIFQFYHLLPELTLYENVLLPSMIAGRPDRKWATEVLKRVKLLSRQSHYPSELSGGEQQRAAIARALMNKPSLVLCDEPTGNLDEETAESIYELLNQLNRQEGQAFLIVTHDESWAWNYPRILRLHDGMLLRENRGEVQIEQINK
ncbi:MAG: ABC transporter ATP-binding protein [Candidatus Omnitrophica bacterium]|nr:ABC transporter ATP-binding protein [Candidatus Omnitrophota bacterium]MDD5671401.1 ABC transporter ATP-binding protein [Candidatus Omnitrophota bacterium]